MVCLHNENVHKYNGFVECVNCINFAEMQKKTKVLQVLHAVGGVDVYVRLISRAIDSTTFEMVIVHGQTDTEKSYCNKENKTIPEYRISIDREIHPIKDFKSILELIKIIKKEDPDFIHAHSAKGGIIARAASIFTKTKVFYTPHAFSYLSAESKRKKLVFLWIEKLFRLSNVKILATSKSEAERAKLEVGFKEENVMIFENCVHSITDEKRNHPTSFNLPKRFISSVGRPSYQKNIEAMVEVFRKVNEKMPDVHLVLMGVGFYAPNVEKVKELLIKYKLEDKFIMLPWISQNEIFTIIDKSELYISTSRYEGLPYSVIESLALGKACVVSDCDGNRDLITDNLNGFVIPQENLMEEMPDAIIKILLDENLKNKFEESSTVLFNQKYNIDKAIKKLEDIYINYSS